VSRFDGGGVSLGWGRGPRGDGKWCLINPFAALMPASTTNALSRQPLIQVLRSITNPRNRRGVRLDLPTVLSLAVTGVLAGCRSLTAIWEHAIDLTASDLRSLGVEPGPGPALGSHPSAGSCRTWTPHMKFWLLWSQREWVGVSAPRSQRRRAAAMLSRLSVAQSTS